MNLRTAAIAAALAVVGGVSFAPVSTAEVAEPFCHGTFEAHAAGPVRLSDQTQEAHGTGSCTAAFQGFPLGVIGRYDALSIATGEPDPTAPAEVHVEVWLELTNGTKRKYAECEDGNPAIAGNEPRFGTAQCSFESNGETATPFSAPEPLPTEIVGISCIAHSHARVKTDTAPVGRFGCYSTDAAEAELRGAMGIPADPDPEPDPGPELAPPPTPDQAPAGPPSVITSVVSNSYSPSQVVVTANSDVRYVNMDMGVWHDVVALDARRPAGTAPWCTDARFADGCPLFYTPLIKGAPGAAVEVLGLADALPGDYRFTCTIHLGMVGTITVVDG